MTTLAFEGDVSGVDICTVAFEPKQLEIMADVNVPGSTERVMQLLNDEPGRETLGPFAANDANVRTTKTRGMAYFPFEFMEPLLGIVPALMAGMRGSRTRVPVSSSSSRSLWSSQPRTWKLRSPFRPNQGR
jgi:hypothetical protein